MAPLLRANEGLSIRCESIFATCDGFHTLFQGDGPLDSEQNLAVEV